MTGKLVDGAVEHLERRLSRRGFLAACGKVGLAIGAAVAGGAPDGAADVRGPVLLRCAVRGPTAPRRPAARQAQP